MRKSEYQPLTCSACDLKFRVHKKDYDKSHAYNCPMCMSANIVTKEDLKSVKPLGREKESPTFNRTIINDDKPQPKKEEQTSTDKPLEIGMRVWLGHCNKEGIIIGRGKIYKTKDQYKIKIGADSIFFSEDKTLEFRHDWMERENERGAKV